VECARHERTDHRIDLAPDGQQRTDRVSRGAGSRHADVSDAVDRAQQGVEAVRRDAAERGRDAPCRGESQVGHRAGRHDATGGEDGHPVAGETTFVWAPDGVDSGTNAADAPATSPGSAPDWLIVTGIVLAVMVVIAIIILLVIVSRRRSAR